MQNHTLKAPVDYLQDLQKLREQNKYAKAWKLRVESKTNRHTTSYGYSWGWYEVFPHGTVRHRRKGKLTLIETIPYKEPEPLIVYEDFRYD